MHLSRSMMVGHILFLQGVTMRSVLSFSLKHLLLILAHVRTWLWPMGHAYLI